MSPVETLKATGAEAQKHSARLKDAQQKLALLEREMEQLQDAFDEASHTASTLVGRSEIGLVTADELATATTKRDDAKRDLAALTARRDALKKLLPELQTAAGVAGAEWDAARRNLAGELAASQLEPLRQAWRELLEKHRAYLMLAATAGREPHGVVARLGEDANSVPALARAANLDATTGFGWRAGTQPKLRDFELLALADAK